MALGPGLVTIALFFTVVVLPVGCNANENPGTFRGEVIVQWIKESGDDRAMKLLEPFAYEDPNGVDWAVPAGTVVDGASIPRILWSTVGPPFVGDYRRASVVHDYYCQLKNRPWKDVHNMFYYACLTDGVNKAKARRMWIAVRGMGPRWPRGVGLVGTPLPRRLSEDEVIAIQDWADKEDPSLNEIEKRIDKETAKKKE